MSNTTMMACFWATVGLACCLDFALAYAARRHQYRSERSWLRDMPAAFYCCAMITSHMLSGPSLIFGGVTAWALAGIPVLIIAWELYDGAPMHPLIGAVLGAVTGRWLWPV